MDFQTWAEEKLQHEVEVYMLRQRRLADAIVSARSAHAAHRLLADLLTPPKGAALVILRDLLPEDDLLTVWWPDDIRQTPIACTEEDADAHQERAKRAEDIPF